MNLSSCCAWLQIFAEAKNLLPGGVNSPVRAFKSVGGQPIIFDHVKGAYCYDVDNNKYIDYIGSWGPAIVGHCNDEVNVELKAQIDKGTSFGAPCYLEVRTDPLHDSGQLLHSSCLSDLPSAEDCYPLAACSIILPSLRWYRSSFSGSIVQDL